MLATTFDGLARPRRRLPWLWTTRPQRAAGLATTLLLGWPCVWATAHACLLATPSDAHALHGHDEGWHVHVMLLAGEEARAGATRGEYEVKAEFVERFTHFIDWPDSSFADRQAPFVVCLVGEGPLAPALERVVTRGTIQERPARLRKLTRTDDVEGCHVIYLAPSEHDRVAATLTRAAGKPILTVGDSSGFCDRGVLVNLFVDAQSYVRFEINTEAVRVSGLKFSAKLLRLARIVGNGAR